MQDIIKVVAQKTGLSESMAKVAVDTVLSLVKEKLPDSVGGILDSFVGTSATSATTKKSSTKKDDNPLGDILGGLGSLLGGKK
ncbi:MAG: hypothetical protein LBR34_08260 [Prevotella sp.]|jgi:nucleoid DNA-binding protein|nr:hypothetical protein [Prevotella sp.]